MNAKFRELKKLLAEIDDLNSAAALFYWDQATYMPPGGTAARGRQIATLERLAHEKFIDPGIGRLLEDLRPLETGLPYDSDDAGLIRVTRRGYERAVKVPASFAEEFARHTSASYQAWTEARPADDFAKVRPYLEKTLELSRRYADFFPGYEHIADPLLDLADQGLKVSDVRPLFAALRKELVPLARRIAARAGAVDDACLRRHFPAGPQADFTIDVVRRLGYDFNRGRQDLTHHPFSIKFSLTDVRITTRVDENCLGEALFASIHEAGHGMYIQEITMDFEGTPLAHGTSGSVHESQSRLWENTVGRSRGFWKFFYPRLQAAFPAQLGEVTRENFYRAINKVEPSLIRTRADEVTYDLHVMLRFELELALLEGKLSVRDLPEAWRERYREDLGVAPSDDRDGVMQDMHWYSGRIGGEFQSYTLGNFLRAQFFDAALKAHPEIPARIEAGDFRTLHEWLRENIYRHGSKFTTAELVKRVTGSPIGVDHYLRYLREKYGELYRLS